MSKFKVREEVVVKNANGKWLSGTVVNYNDCREPGMEYAIDISGYPGGLVFAGENEILSADKIHSKEEVRSKSSFKEAD